MEKKYDVLLINPAFSQKAVEHKQNIPVNLLELGSFLTSKGVKVKLIDCLVMDDYLNQIKKLSGSVILVGFGVMTIQIPSALEITKVIKSVNPDVKFVWGGVHPTLFPEQTLIHNNIDFIIRGEGEWSIYNLFSCLKKNKPYKNINGITFKQDDKIISNPLVPLLKVDDLPSLDWSLIDENVLDRYRYSYNKYKPLQVSTSRGCPHRCTFCVNVCTGNKWRGKSPEEVIRDISEVYNKLKIRFIKFRDECFFVDKDRVKKILKGLTENKINIKWQANCRVNYFTNGVIDKEVLNLMKKTNCYGLDFGVESGSERMLKMIKKEIVLNDVIIAAKTLKEYDIVSSYSFMIGMPYESKNEMIKTIKFIKRLKKINPLKIRIRGPQAYRPYPGGEMYEDALRLGWKEPKSLEIWEKIDCDMDISTTSNKFPWVKDKLFVDYIWLYSIFATSTWGRISEIKDVKAPKIFLYAFALWCKLRWFLGIYNHLFEAKLLIYYYRLVKKK